MSRPPLPAAPPMDMALPSVRSVTPQSSDTASPRPPRPPRPGKHGRDPVEEAKRKNEAEEWRCRAYEHEDLADIRSRVDPFWRICSFVQQYKPGQQHVKKALEREHVLRLIHQHLEFYGLSKASKRLATEAGIHHDTQPLPEDESRLLFFLRNSIRRVDAIYDMTLEQHENTAPLEDLLCVMSLFEIEKEEEEMQNSTNDVNIWEEGSGDQYITFTDDPDSPEGEAKKKIIKAATLNKLVCKLTSDTGFDQSFVDMFLMTYKSFTTPDILLSKIIQRFQAPESAKEELGEKSIHLVQMRVSVVLKKWISLYVQDFESENVLSQLQMFISFLRSSDNKTSRSNAKLLQTAYQKASESSRQSKVRMFKTAAPAPKVNMHTIFQPKISIYDIDPEEVARQLSLADFEIYHTIRPSELLGQAWSKPKTKHKSPNVLKFISRFNNLSTWVATSIIKVPKVKARTKLMARMIKIAEHLRALNNFNGCMAILSGLNQASVHRLRWTRKELPPRSVQTLAELEETLSSNNAFKVYREVLASTNPPCIPYLGVYLTDLTFIDENPNNLNGLVNFFKRRLIYNVISRVQQYQDTFYNLQPVWQIQRLLLKLPTLDEDTMHRLSLKREPRKAERAEIE
eukprot:TRINITY_DN2930_c0_g1_i4.p1 TRINITY_DN2930_c0_g1~~TRINITY_DN2930_c0_g1_i4.p1  ORF type:complete len:663 (-),score=176.22 TRINITY_DN2930_c0_g1_i4:230-2110(-)